MTWEELEKTCKECTLCSLSETRTNCVFGVGNREARLMFVGEAPGEKEDLSGIPFVGAAGQLLDKYLTAVDIDRDSVYIANILKCRPPKNRDPDPEEQDKCIGYLREQVVIAIYIHRFAGYHGYIDIKRAELRHRLFKQVSDLGYLAGHNGQRQLMFSG